MDYGLRTFDVDGNPVIDITSRLNRFRHLEEVAKDASGSVVLTDIDGQLTIEISLSVNVLDHSSPWFMASHEISRSGTTVSWNASAYSLTRCDGLMMVFFYA